MKERIAALLMLLCMLLPELALAGTKGYLNQKMATRSGPGTKYTEELGTRPIDTDITVIAQAETNGTVWYQVEFTMNQKLYRCYTGKKRVNASGNIPWESPDYTEDTLTAGADAYYGPGTNYAKRKQSVYKGTTVRVFGVEGDWALCEYKEGSKWCRGYIPVEKLANTVGVPVTPTPEPTAAPTATPAPTPRVIANILDPDNHLCIDYYGNLYDYTGRTDEFAEMVGALPVMSYFDGVPCIRSHTQVYSGPGQTYWCRYNTGSGYAYTGKNDTNLRIYGQENGWIMIRYPSDANGGYRYGWTIPAAISVANQERTPNVDFAYIDLQTTRYVDATDDPDRSIQYVGTSISEQITVTGLAFLDEKRNWVYCEFILQTNSGDYKARGFIPADGLRVK